MGLISEYRLVADLLKQKQSIVFYAESRHYFIYYEKLIADLLANTNVTICYITSDAGDPLLKQAPARIKVICIKWMLGFLFSRLKADVVIMTMPDLDNFLFKRSKEVGHYIYVFHAAVSTHQQYRKKAFVNYDSIFCTGHYQQEEIRYAELLYNKKAKTLIPYGYPLLDAIEEKVNQPATKGKEKTILIAPSWFEGCIFDTCLPALLKQVASLPYHIILRSHPEYEKRKKKEFKKIQQLIAAHSNISIDSEPNVINRLIKTDVLITDRSGIAFEFAFGACKPVLFIDTVLKQINPDWKELGLEPIENSLRSQLGISLLPAQMEKIPAAIKEIEMMKTGFVEKIKLLKEKYFYNSAEAYKKGWEYVISQVKKD